jgi:hypothetical protein
VEFELIPGDHYTMHQQPNVTAIAKALTEASMILRSALDYRNRSHQAGEQIGVCG